MWDHLQDRASCDIYRQCVDGCFWLQQPMYHMGLRTCDLLGRILLLSHHLLGDTICPNLLDTCTVGPSQGSISMVFIFVVPPVPLGSDLPTAETIPTMSMKPVRIHTATFMQYIIVRWWPIFSMYLLYPGKVEIWQWVVLATYGVFSIGDFTCGFLTLKYFDPLVGHHIIPPRVFQFFDWGWFLHIISQNWWAPHPPALYLEVSKVDATDA
mmetsp:Transcript_101971/g.218350  ORF Transcript_101971/g.218350 Transcript_101971/m.218350 type:complete len:211 (+) Transcript_101971:179-811(+)